MGDKKTGRPESKNVDYFPHFTKGDRMLDLIEFRHKTEGYAFVYKLQEMLADAPYHKLSVKTQDEKDMFEMGIGIKKEVVDDVINILVNNNKIDRELWEKERVIWWQEFVERLSAVWYKRGKRIPTKEGGIENFRTQKDDRNKVYDTDNGLSGTGNSEESKKKVNRKEKEVNDDTLLSFDEYQKLYPDKDVHKSLNKLFGIDANPTHRGVMGWLNNEKNGKKPEFRRTTNGHYIVGFCSKCNKKYALNDKWQLKEGSPCCHVEYQPEPMTKQEILIKEK